jgi:hypothetical protein
MRIGYVRLLPEDRARQVQRQALQGAGCRRIFEEHARFGVSPSTLYRNLPESPGREPSSESPAAYA